MAYISLLYRLTMFRLAGLMDGLHTNRKQSGSRLTRGNDKSPAAMEREAEGSGKEKIPLVRERASFALSLHGGGRVAMVNINPSVVFGSSATRTPVKWLCQSNIISLLVLCVAYWAVVSNATCICNFIHKMNASPCRPVITSGAIRDLMDIEIDTAWGNGKGVVDILLPLAFQLHVFILQRSVCDLQIRKLHFQIGDIKHEFGVSQSFRQFCNGTGFGTERFNEVYHV